VLIVRISTRWINKKFDIIPGKFENSIVINNV